MKKYQKYNVEATEDRVKESIKDNTYDRANSIKSFIEGLDMIEDTIIYQQNMEATTKRTMKKSIIEMLNLVGIVMTLILQFRCMLMMVKWIIITCSMLRY